MQHLNNSGNIDLPFAAVSLARFRVGSFQNRAKPHEQKTKKRFHPREDELIFTSFSVLVKLFYNTVRYHGKRNQTTPTGDNVEKLMS
eukprot:4275745-Amphidinium_carterae.1